MLLYCLDKMMKKSNALPILLLLLTGVLSYRCQDADIPSSPVAVPDKAEQLIEALTTPQGSSVMVAAHRADWQHAPENSLQAIEQSIAMGCDVVELDIRLTADRALILMHDAALERTSNGVGDVIQRKLPYLRTLFLKDKNGNLTTERIPTLEEALYTAKGKILVALDKYDYVVPEVQAVLARTGTSRQIILLGFAPLADTRVSLRALLDSVQFIPGVTQQTPQRQSYIQEYTEKDLPAAFAFWYDEESSPVLSLIPQVKQQGYRAWVNTTEPQQCAGHTDAVSLTDPAAGWGWVIDHGADIILTDRPAQLLQYLRENNLHE